MKTVKRLWVTAMALCLGLSLISCGMAEEEVEESGEQTGRLESAAVNPEITDIELTREFVGTIEADTETNVIPLANGEILTMNFEVGDVVHEGDLMLTLDDTDARLSMAQAEAGLKTSQAGLQAAQAASDAAKAAKTASDAQIQESLNQAVTESQEKAASAQDAAEALKAAEYSKNLAAQTYENADSHIHDYNHRKEYLENKIKELNEAVNALERGGNADDPAVIAEMAALEVNVDALKSELDVVNSEYSKDDLVLARYQAAIEQQTSQYDVASAKRAKEIADKVLSDYMNFSLGRAVADAQAQAAAADAQVQSSAAAVNEAAAEITGAEADMTTAQVNLDRTQVLAPVSGVVTAKRLKEHDTAGNGEAAYVISSADSVNITFYVTEKTVKLLSPGQKTMIRKGDQECEGNIIFVSNVLDEETGMFKVKSSVSAKASDFVKGTTVKLETATEKAKGALTVPVDALWFENRRAFVYVARDGKAIRTEVELGVITDESVQVLSGLSTEDVVLLSRSTVLRNGVDVEVYQDSAENEGSVSEDGKKDTSGENASGAVEEDNTEDGNE